MTDRSQIDQASQAIDLFYTMSLTKPELSITIPVKSTPVTAASQQPPTQKFNPAWDAIYQQLTTQIKTRHYSPKTLKAYLWWTHQLQNFTQDKHPQHLSVDDVSAFLSDLAIEKHVSASSQNQAFHALLFVFQHILKKEYKGFHNVVRAKHKPYIPVVLSRPEVNKVIAKLAVPYDLVAKLLYGCGLRISECLKLRVQDLNLEMGILTIHNGKGQKDRTVPLPQVLTGELEQQIEKVNQQHQADLATGYAGVFLVQALGTKYKNAAKEFVWQWLFPAKQLTFVPETNEYRRYHLHETHFQRAIKQAVQKAGIPQAGLGPHLPPQLCQPPLTGQL